MNQQIDLPANISSGRLPQTYQDAKLAISKCAKIDECKNWADKAEALASYAKQANDDELRTMARRIQARAVRRCGELMQEIKPASGSRSDLGPVPAPGSRKSAARNAGLSDRQRKAALRVANVPNDQFEQQVEGKRPPTVTELAKQGTKKRQLAVDVLRGRDPDDFKAATRLMGQVDRFVKFLAVEASSFDAAMRGMSSLDVTTMLDQTAAIAAHMRTLVAKLKGGASK